MPDSQINCTVAYQKARQIELDIVSGNFDPTLKKYKPQRISQKSTFGNVAGLFEKFMKEEQKTKRLYKATLCRYEAILRHLERYFQNQLLEFVSDARGSELEIRRQLIQTGAVDVMIAVSSNFFYTVQFLTNSIFNCFYHLDKCLQMHF